MAHLQITGIRVSAGGTRHEHITHIFGSFGSKTRFQGVSDIFYGANTFYTRSGLLGGETPVGRCAANQAVLSEHDYLRTYGNGQWTDNLLALPRM